MSRLFRVKCTCGEVCDVQGNATPCPRCKNPIILPPDGMIQIYRKGSPIGMAVGYGIYINGQPLGHIGNTESVFIPVSYGSYNLHFTCGMTRRCKDLVVNITPENRFGFVKAYIKAGFWSNTIMIEPSSPEEMPKY